MHDFGAVLAVPGQLLVHSFRVPNDGSTSYEIECAHNPKPCCVDFGVESKSIPPGEPICAHLTLKVGSTPIGKLEWWATIWPKDASDPVHRFVGTAAILPRAKLEWKREPTGATLLAGEQREFDGCLVLHGRSGEDLSKPEISVSSTAVTITIGASVISQCAWDSSFEQAMMPVKLMIDSGGAVGYHQATVELAWPALKHRLTAAAQWETIPPIRSEPRALIFRAGESGTAKTVRLTSVDGRPFRMLRVTAPPGFHATGQDDGATSNERFGVVRASGAVPEAGNPIPSAKSDAAEETTETAAISVVRSANTDPGASLSHLDVDTSLGRVSVPLFCVKRRPPGPVEIGKESQ